MSLITCPACSGKVSSQASACPHCAHPIKPSDQEPRTTMGKRMLCLFIGSCIMALGLIMPFPLGAGGIIFGGIMVLAAIMTR